MPQLPWFATHSLLREEFLDIPTAAYGDPRLDGPVRALLAGEPQRALGLLATSPADPRASVALTAWARQLDRNWYPGDVGAETATVSADGYVVPGRGDDAVAQQLVMIAHRGPTGLRTARTLLEMALRGGAMLGVQQALALAAESLDAFAQYAAQTGQQFLMPWITLMRADFSRRANLQADADALLVVARQQATFLQSGPRLALTYLVEGDWYAAPGSSAESLGWDLAPQNDPCPLAGDFSRAVSLWDQAEAALSGWDVPRLRAALALRRAWQAGLAGRSQAQREFLAQAGELSRRAGDSAAHHLAAVHELVADIDGGRLGQHLLQLGGGWSPPQYGPVAKILQWAATAGSRSWCVGLGRLLQRCGDRWFNEGSIPRARVAYLAALPLISSDPSVPVRTLQTALAHADGRFNLAVNALLRLDRVFMTAAPAGGDDNFAFAQSLEATISMIGALRERTRGAAASITADRMQRLRDDLETARLATEARLGPAAGPVPSTMDELRAAVLAMRGDGSLSASGRAAVEATQLMVRMQLGIASAQVMMLDVLIAITRGDAAQRAGIEAEAERWFAEARKRASRPGTDAFLPAFVELSAGRKEAARTAFAAVADQMADDRQFPFWVQIGDMQRAAEALARQEKAGADLSHWRSRLSIAELRLAQGDAATARDELRAAVEALHASLGLLMRDPDRLDACDQPEVAALFTLRARAALLLGDVVDSLAAAEEGRQLVARELEVAEHELPWAPWQRAAAHYAAVSNTVIARLAASAPDPERAAGFAALDRADQRLAEAEHALEQRSPGILLRRAAPPVPPSISDLQAGLPDGVVCLEYLAAGDDLIGWAITSRTITPSTQAVRYRDLSVMVRAFHAACSRGRANAAELSAALLVPFAEVLRSHERVVVVPFGALNLVPFHALTLDGVPLGASHVVSYAPSLMAAVGVGRGLDHVVDTTRALVVGDPAFDAKARPHLRKLPGSRLEAERVATLLGVPDPLIGDAASEPAVTVRLEDCTLMHISSHGHLDELSPFSSSLVLAGHDELTVAELVGLRFSTSLAVLTGCDTGRGNATLGGDVVGLTRSLLRGGVRQVVVSLWPVDDWVAPVVMDRFYDGLRRRRPPAYALAEAQRSVLALDADALRAAYVALGGGTGDAQRRGVVLDPELRDDEDLPLPLGGDAERYWAPFVLVS